MSTDPEQPTQCDGDVSRREFLGATGAALAVTHLLTLGFLAFGAHVLSRLKVEAFPDVTNVQVMVISLYPGQAAEEV